MFTGQAALATDSTSGTGRGMAGALAAHGADGSQKAANRGVSGERR